MSDSRLEIDHAQAAINIVGKHLPTDPRRGLESSIAAALTSTRKQALEDAAAVAENFPGYVWDRDFGQNKRNRERHKRIAKAIRRLH